MLNPNLSSYLPQAVLDLLKYPIEQAELLGISGKIVATTKYKGVTVPTKIYLDRYDYALDIMFANCLLDFLDSGDALQIGITHSVDMENMSLWTYDD